MEDDDSVRKSLSRLLRSAGFASKEFGSGDEFLAAGDVQEQSCVLLDITMPGLPALQLQAELNQRHIDVPVIVVSARDDSDTRRMARELGAWCFFRKPVDDQALLDAIHWVLSSHKHNTAAQ